jgi:hypothetical protein
MFREVAKHGSAGVVFTLVMDCDRDEPSLRRICRTFRRHGARFCIAELQAPLPVRLKRNRTSNRLAHKPSKRDLKWSAMHVRRLDRLRLASPERFAPPGEFVRIDTARRSAMATARWIFRRFRLQR